MIKELIITGMLALVPTIAFSGPLSWNVFYEEYTQECDPNDVLLIQDTSEGTNGTLKWISCITGITPSQSQAIVDNTAKVGITTQQASDIEANNLKVGITTQQASDIEANNLKVGITTAQSDAIVDHENRIVVLEAGGGGTGGVPVNSTMNFLTITDVSFDGQVWLNNAMVPGVGADNYLWGINTIAAYVQTEVAAATGSQFSEPVAILTPDGDQLPFHKAREAIVLEGVNCIASGGGTISIDIQECDANAANCTSTGLSQSFVGSTNVHDSTLTDPNIAVGSWLRIVVGTPSGNVNFITCHVYGE